MSFGENLDELVEKSTNDLHAAHPSWERVRIGDVAHLVNGFAFKSKGFNDKEGTPIVRIRDVVKGTPGTFYRGPIDDPKMTVVDNGEIAIGMDGDFNCRVWNGGKALLNQRVCTLRADENFYSQKFLAFALPGYLKLINDHTSSVTVKHLSSLTVRDIPLPLPPLNEQHRIVDKIETLFTQLDKGEEALREVQKLLARYRQSVLKAAVTGRLTGDWRAENAHRLEHGRDLLARILQTRRETWEGRGKYKEPVAPDTSDLLELPAGWVWASFDQLFHVFGGATPSRRAAENWNGDIPWVSSGEVAFCRIKDTAEKITSTGYESCSTKIHPPGTLLLAMIGEGKTRGQAAILDIPACNNQNAAAIRVSQSGVPAEYVYYFLMGRYDKSRKEGQGGNQPALNGEKVKGFLIPLPSHDEMAEIVARVESAFANSAKVEQWCQTELARSAALRQSILKDAFAGRLVPQDPADEPATKLLARIKATRDTRPKKGRTVPA